MNSEVSRPLGRKAVARYCSQLVYTILYSSCDAVIYILILLIFSKLPDVGLFCVHVYLKGYIKLLSFLCYYNYC